jgi:hypothetical protein
MIRLPFTSGVVIALTAVSLSLGGCATPKERIIYRDVKVMVPVPCKVEMPSEPAFAGDTVDLAAPIYDLVRALLAERDNRIAERIELRAAAKSCS